ncbi:hypothetical protein K450DRAFT_226290 [Umbelopsis ramanniana AG]|uniref:Uncharacterized protein n=1 Tax=Umbelopsis ramanniana AG TaxID=1314678 RepID=A0AAD5HGZ1_UMBRA|nr:uncharacterized protein K450DRAFT_226290 [Umbelopsis ramanniana AG]KAI8582644.1 hypothetical protein K450DRAFT_226290 [Umbelopsis ramanniana AG]
MHQFSSRKAPIRASDVVLPSLVYTIANYVVTKYLSVRAASLDVLETWDPDFNLDLSGVAGFLGGDEAVSATVAAFSTGNIGWTGWYASPGAYAVAKYFGRTLEGKVWKACFPGERVDLSEAFRLHSISNYQFYGLESFTKCRPHSNIPDCLVADVDKIIAEDKLIVFKPLDLETERTQPGQDSLPKKDEQLENGTPALVHIFTVGEQSKDEQSSSNHSNETPSPKSWVTTDFYKISPSIKKAMYGVVALVVDLVFLAILGRIRDWWILSIILASLVCNFLFVTSLRSCKIEVVKHKVSSLDTPPGHGIFAHDTENTFMAVFGTEDMMNNIAKTKLQVTRNSTICTKRPSTEPTESTNTIFSELWTGLACMSMQLLFLAQILITPQGTLAGQIIFLASLLVGWIANACYSYIDVTEAQRQIVRDNCGAKHVLTLQGDRTQVLLTLAFLVDLEGDDFIEIYTNLLAKSADWKTALKAVSDKVKNKRLKNEQNISLQSEGNQSECNQIGSPFSERLQKAIAGAKNTLDTVDVNSELHNNIQKFKEFLEGLKTQSLNQQRSSAQSSPTLEAIIVEDADNGLHDI